VEPFQPPRFLLQNFKACQCGGGGPEIHTETCGVENGLFVPDKGRQALFKSFVQSGVSAQEPGASRARTPLAHGANCRLKHMRIADLCGGNVLFMWF
jgi:hypothetical protein